MNETEMEKMSVALCEGVRKIEMEKSNSRRMGGWTEGKAGRMEGLLDSFQGQSP